MSVVTEKRTIDIPSLLVNKSLVRQLGERLEKETWLKGHLDYTFNSKTKNIKSSGIEDFVNADWGSGWRNIEIASENTSSSVNVSIDFRRFYSSEFSVAGKNPTEVDGITKGMLEVFNNHVTGYHRVNRNLLLTLSTIITVLIFSSPFIWQIARFATNSSFGTTLKVEQYIIILVILCGFGGTAILLFYAWLMPRFEYEGMTQQHARKWIIAAISGSQIITILLGIILGKLLG